MSWIWCIYFSSLFFSPSLQTVQCLQLKWNWELSKFVASETLKTSRKLVRKTPLDLPRSELLRSILDWAAKRHRRDGAETLQHLSPERLTKERRRSNIPCLFIVVGILCLSVRAFGVFIANFFIFIFHFWRKVLIQETHLWGIFGFEFYFPLTVLFFFFFFFKFQTWFLVQSWQNWTKALRKKQEKKEKSPPCPQLPAWSVSSTAWITDCPPHSATSPLLLHDLLPLIPFPLYFFKFFFVSIFCSSVYVAYLFYLLRYF